MKTKLLLIYLLKRKPTDWAILWKGVVPVNYLLLVLMALYSFAPAHLSKTSHIQLPPPNIPHPTSDPQQSITGTVSDAGGPIPGVLVQVKDTNRTTMTDENGYYSISAIPGEVLVFSYAGYETLEWVVGIDTVIDIEMYESITHLEEAVINAGYYTVKDRERTGNIARITAKDIETQPVTNVLATMQGRMPGVDITQETGMPGGGFNIKIRGQNSLRPDGNAPLYIIDGVPYSSEATGTFLITGSAYPTLSNPLNTLNPDYIESIEVLKDADATAIYGSRGANGVVLITTKKGKQGKTKFTVNTSTGAAWVSRFIDLLNTDQYLSMRAEAFQNDGFSEYPANAYDVNGTWSPEKYTDWQKELIGGIAQIYTINTTATGGSELTRFLVGGHYNSQTTVFPRDFKYEKGGVQVNLNHNSPNKRFSMVFSGNYNIQNNNQPTVDLTNLSRRLAPNAPSLYDADSNLNWENNTWTNPLAELNSQFSSQTNDLIGNLSLQYSVFPFLDLKTNLGYTDTRSREEKTIPSTIYNPSFGYGPENSALFVNNADRNSWIMEPQLSLNTDLAHGTLNIILGTTFQQQTSNYFTEYGFGFTSNALINNLAAASNRFLSRSEEFIYKYQAVFGRLNYNWKNRYIINLTARRDGSSRFGPGNQYANFGAVGAAWIFSNEEFSRNLPLISFGKIRGSFGTTGNDQIGDYQFLDTYSTGSVYQGNVGLTPTRLFNPDFKWELNKKYEAAIEIGLLHNRIFLTGSYYQHRSSNQLVGIPLAGTTGFTTMQANWDANVQNSGYEFTLKTINARSPDFNWESQVNLSFPKTRLISFPDLENSTYKDTYRVGYPLNIQLVYQYTGIDPETGIYQFYDVNGDGRISFPDDRQTVVDLTPDLIGGLMNSITYKRWSLDFLLHFTKQQKPRYSFGIPGTMSNIPADILNEAQILTAGLNQEALMAQGFYANSDANIVDASFLRLKNISITYKLPLQTNNIQLQLFLQAQNLFTITSYKYGDPEFIQSGFLPPLKQISSGFQLTF